VRPGIKFLPPTSLPAAARPRVISFTPCATDLIWLPLPTNGASDSPSQIITFLVNGAVTAFLPCRSAGGERPRKRLFGSFERFLTDTICPKGPRHARDGGRPHFAGGWTQWPVPVRRPSRHAADPKPPSQTRGDSCARNPCQFASMSVARLGAKTTPWLGRDLDEERLEHPPGLLGPRFDGAAHPAHVAGGRARIS
jgi:hypothetical protein